MGGIGYYRFPAVIPWIEIGLAVLLVVLPLPAVRFARFEEEAGILWSSASGGGNIVRLLLRGGRLRYG